MNRSPTQKSTALSKSAHSLQENHGAEKMTEPALLSWPTVSSPRIRNILPSADSAFYWEMAASPTARRKYSRDSTLLIYGADFSRRSIYSTSIIPATTRTVAQP